VVWLCYNTKPVKYGSQSRPRFSKSKKLQIVKKSDFFLEKMLKIFFWRKHPALQNMITVLIFFIFSAHFGFLGSRSIDIIESGSAPASGDHINIATVHEGICVRASDLHLYLKTRLQRSGLWKKRR
jgi:hypothetical protein